MAKVKSVNSFYVNKESFPELKFNPEIVQDSSPKFDFGINSLLTDISTNVDKLSADNDGLIGKIDNKENRCLSVTSSKIETPSCSLLDALAENHLKENKMPPELSFHSDFNLSDLLSNDDHSSVKSSKSKKSPELSNDGDFSLADLLSNDDHSFVKSSKNKMSPNLSNDGDFSLSDLLCNDGYSSVKSSKNVIQSESDNLFDFLLTEDNGPIIEKKSSVKNNVSFDDLSDWMNSSITQSSNSSKFSPDSYLLDDVSEGKHKNASPSLLKVKTKDNTDTQLSDLLESIQEKSESSKVDLVNIHKEGSVDSYELSDSLDSTDSSKTNNKTNESTNELSDDDFLPDIDLTFCIKKSSKNDYLFYGNSPETADSGFDESDFVLEKLSIPYKREFLYKDMFMPQIDSDSKSTSKVKVKQSLFSKAISAKPKMDDSRKLKLKNVMSELLKGSTIPLPPYPTQESKLPEIVDRSNENIIVSQVPVLKFGDEK